MIERNWEGIKQAREFLLKTEFFFCLFDNRKTDTIDQIMKQKILKNLENFSVETFEK